MSNVYTTTIGIFLWKHWKCFQYSWIKNIIMIIVPIAIAGFQIHVTSGTIKAPQTIFDPINEVKNVLQMFFVMFFLIIFIRLF